MIESVQANIHHQSVIDHHLAQLLAQDPRLIPIQHLAGPLHPRMHPAGFEGLARVICGQQLSVASADAIWQRFVACHAAIHPQAFLDLGESGLQGVGLSRSKFQTIQTVAQAILAGHLDLEALARQPVETALQTLTHYKGIGPWTAEIYLMFCAGHPDVFPAGDLALRKGVGEGLGMDPTPGTAELSRLALQWAPFRSVAALLFWRYYGALKQRAVAPM